MDIKIIIATHKRYWMPDDHMYLPVHVGAEGKEAIGYTPDNTGDNISFKNANYCELTGLYWAWRNLKAEYIGLVHYRRYFSNSKLFKVKKEKVINKAELEVIIDNNDTVDIYLPKPRNYWIETNYSQYAHAHHAIDLDTTREVLKEKYPEYLAAFDNSMKRTIGHRFNMFIMKKDKFDEYCEWLFAVLLELENRLDISSYSKNDSRVFGFVSERLLDIWLDTNNYGYKTLPYVFMERQNWIKKGSSFLMRRFQSK